MSRKGSSYDNAPMESVFATLKRELVHPGSLTTRNHIRAALFEKIELSYNRQRLHSALGYRSPVDFEAEGHHP